MSRTYSEEEKRDHLEKFRTSGKSLRAYAKENKMSVTTLFRWIKANSHTDTEFGELHLVEHNGNTNDGESIIIEVEHIKILLPVHAYTNVIKVLSEVLNCDK